MQATISKAAIKKIAENIALYHLPDGLSSEQFVDSEIRSLERSGLRIYLTSKVVGGAPTVKVSNYVREAVKSRIINNASLED